MSSFNLEILTPDGKEFAGECESLLIKTVNGDVEILAGHTEFFAPLGIGRARITKDGKKHFASVSGGFISVTKSKVSVVATTFEFADEIDLKRAIEAKERAETLAAAASDEKSLILAKAKLQRALSRINVYEMRK